MNKNAHKKLVGLTVAVALLAGIAAILYISGAFKTPFGQTEVTTTPKEAIVLEGMLVCLPHKDTSGPHTEECAFGLKAKNGKFYGLRALPQTFMQTQKEVRVTGMLSAVAQNEKYAIVGNIEIRQIEKK